MPALVRAGAVVARIHRDDAEQRRQRALHGAEIARGAEQAVQQHDGRARCRCRYGSSARQLLHPPRRSPSARPPDTARSPAVPPRRRSPPGDAPSRCSPSTTAPAPAAASSRAAAINRARARSGSSSVSMVTFSATSAASRSASPIARNASKCRGFDCVHDRDHAEPFGPSHRGRHRRAEYAEHRPIGHQPRRLDAGIGGTGDDVSVSRLASIRRHNGSTTACQSRQE